MSTLQTPRLTLRPLQPSDAEALHPLFRDTEVMEYWSCRPHATVEQTRVLVDALCQSVADGTHVQWTILRTSDGAVLGKCGYSAWRGSHRRGDISYLLGRSWWGHGYARESLVAMIDYGFDALGLHSIEAGVTPGNTASTRLLEKLGFRLEGYLRENYWAEDRFVDSLIYAILRPEWKTRGGA